MRGLAGCGPPGASRKESWAGKPGRYRPPAERRVAEGRGPGRRAVSRGFFSLFILLQNIVLLILFKFLSNYHTVSSIQNNPTKFCLEKLKSNRNFSIKFKVNEFLNLCFCCK
jgi:hypothetical protein